MTPYADKPNAPPYLLYTLQNVMVSHYSIGSGVGDKSNPTESITLNFSKIEVNYKAQGEEPGLKGTLPGAYHLTTPKPSPTPAIKQPLPTHT